MIGMDWQPLGGSTMRMNLNVPLSSYASSENLYNELGKRWAQAKRGLGQVMPWITRRGRQGIPKREAETLRWPARIEQKSPVFLSVPGL